MSDSVCLKYQIYGLRAIKLVMSQGNTEDLQIFFRHYRSSKVFAKGGDTIKALFPNSSLVVVYGGDQRSERWDECRTSVESFWDLDEEMEKTDGGCFIWQLC